jgi:hypothetical protein
MLTLLPKGVQTKFKTFQIEDFFHLPTVTTAVVHLERIFDKILNGGNGIGAWRKLIYAKKPEVENLVALSF